MPPIAFARRFSAALAFMYFFAAAPATAEVEKFMRHCDGKLCAYYRASVTIPEGWVEDPEASRKLGVQMLLPKGQSFEAAPAKIYVLVRYNREKQPVSAIARDTYRDWRERAKNAKVAKLSDVARQNGKAAFLNVTSSKHRSLPNRDSKLPHWRPTATKMATAMSSWSVSPPIRVKRACLPKRPICRS